MMEESILVPKKRFKGFEEVWQASNLGNKLNLLKDGTHGTHTNVENGYYLLSAKNIKKGKIIITENERQISKSDFKQIHSYFTLEKGDILLTIVGSIGETAIVNLPINYTFQRSVAYLRPKKDLLNSYLYANLKSKGLIKQLLNRQSVSAQAGVYLQDLNELKIVYPLNMEEQQKIGEFFKVLDERIANQERKISKVKALKEAYLTEMFPQEGETVPKRRFKGFQEEWEKFSLENIGNTFSGMSGKTKNDFGHGEAKFVTYVNVFNNPISDEAGLEQVILDDKQTTLKYGDILFTRSSETPDEVGMSAVWLFDKPNVYLNSFCFGFRPKIKMDQYFIGFLL